MLHRDIREFLTVKIREVRVHAHVRYVTERVKQSATIGWLHHRPSNRGLLSPPYELDISVKISPFQRFEPTTYVAC